MSPVLYPKERNAAMDACRMYSMQKEAMEEDSPVLKFMNPSTIVHLVSMCVCVIHNSV